MVLLQSPRGTTRPRFKLRLPQTAREAEDPHREMAEMAAFAAGAARDRLMVDLVPATEFIDRLAAAEAMQ